ncbi:MAG: hypothetical protein J6X55_12560 [Victivallales bacterium]|nr:hypothetical protein [Victivallales bacterium]
MMANYAEVPIGVALIVCDTIIEDKFTNKKSLIGLFGQIHAARLPCLTQSMSLLVSLTGGNGDYPCSITCHHASIDAPVFNLSRTIHFESPNQVLDLVFQLKAVRFPFPDQYWLKVLIDGVPIMMRPLTVVQNTPPAPPSNGQQPNQPPKE